MAVGGKHEKLTFSGRDDDFVYFQERFEARMYQLKLRDVLRGKVTIESLVAGGLSAENAEVKMEDLQYQLWCELIQCLDKKSVMFIRQHRGNGEAAWKALLSKFRSLERPRVQKLLQTLTTLRKEPTETMTDYIMRAEEMNMSLQEVDEQVTDQMLLSLVLKGLPNEYDSFVTVVNFTKNVKNFEEIKQDLINFDADRHRPQPENSAFFSKKQLKCYSCGKLGHKAAECQNRGKAEGTAMTCHKCGRHGHLAKACHQGGMSTPRMHSSTGCSYCKKEGHTLDKCFKRKREEANFVTSTEVSEFSFFGRTERNNLCNDIIVDSGCTNYMLKDKELFISLNEGYHGTVGCANNSESEIRGKGTAKFTVRDSSGEKRTVKLTDALYVPDYTHNLVGVKKLTDFDAEVHFGKDAIIQAQDGTMFPLETVGGLYLWRIEQLEGTRKEDVSLTTSLMRWHERLGHTNMQDVKSLIKTQLNEKLSGDEKCDVCATEKAKRQNISKVCHTRAKARLDIVHCDVLGPVDPMTEDGHKYAIGYIDSYSRFAKVYMMKTRDEVLAKTEQFFADVGVPGTLVTDGAREFASNAFETLCRLNRVRHQFSAPYTPEENGKIERVWGTVVGMARCMLATAGLEKKFWTYALNHAFFVKNQCIHSSHGKSPVEMFWGEQPELEKLKIFGCRAYVFVENKFRKKFDSTAKRGVFLGYSPTSKSCLVGFEEDNRFVVRVTRNVTFDETVMPYRERFQRQGGESENVVESEEEESSEFTTNEYITNTEFTHVLETQPRVQSTIASTSGGAVTRGEDDQSLSETIGTGQKTGRTLWTGSKLRRN